MSIHQIRILNHKRLVTAAVLFEYIHDKHFIIRDGELLKNINITQGLSGFHGCDRIICPDRLDECFLQCRAFSDFSVGNTEPDMIDVEITFELLLRET